MSEQLNGKGKSHRSFHTGSVMSILSSSRTV